MSELGGLQRILCWLRSRIVSLRMSASGKITLLAISGIAAALFIFVGIVSYNVQVPIVSADNVSTSVYVLNTPPTWTVDAEENTASATSTPTNAGQVVTWVGTGTDSNSDSYYLLICKTGSAPTATSGGAPICNGGAGNQWAISALTASAAQATAATTTKETFPFAAESNDWFAWICDNNASLAQCNATYKQTNGDTTKASPFVVNHPPVFTAVTNNSPAIPGATITWNSTATDTDIIRGGDTIRLIVCKANDFTGTSCGGGGAWATSTFATFDPATTTPIVIPSQDKLYNAYAFIIDDNNLVATSTIQGTNSSFTVSNVEPSIAAASISLVDPTSGSFVTLVRPHATSGPYQVTFTVTDNNSCLNSSSGNEISSVSANAYRSSIGSSSCLVYGDYNTNNCYPQAAAPNTNFTCVQDVSSCSGSSDTTATFTCSFALWYNADPTDGGSQYPSENWLASAKAIDDQTASSGVVQASTGNELLSFLAFSVAETSIGYGSLQPGQQIDPFVVATSTTLRAYGNVGMDQTLYGDTMCPGWTVADSCDVNGVSALNDIPISNQKAATSTVAYASSQAYTITGSTSPVSVPLHVLKTTATSSPQSKLTLWAIRIPGTITLAGTYTGQNTITAVTSSSADW